MPRPHSDSPTAPAAIDDPRFDYFRVVVQMRMLWLLAPYYPRLWWWWMVKPKWNDANVFADDLLSS